MTLDDVALAELEALAARATAGEWSHSDGGRVWGPDGDQVAMCYGNLGSVPHPTDCDEVAAFIARARTAVPALIAELRAARRERDEAFAHAAAMRDWAAAWILRVREACCYRDGWEEGMTAMEAGEAITDVLANLGCDAGTENPEQVAEAKRLLALPVTYGPPELERARRGE